MDTRATQSKETNSGAGYTCTRDPELNCDQCRLRGLCLPQSLSLDEIQLLDRIIERPRPYHNGEHVYRTQEGFSEVYVIRSGAVKTFNLDEHGNELTTGFYLPGDLLGIDGIATNAYPSSAIALDTSTLCVLSFEKLGTLTREIPRLQRHVFEVMSEKIVQQEALLMQLNRARSTAATRIAGFLISLALRHRRLGLSATSFRLPMSRKDIGSYVGLSIETVSRTLTDFDRRGLCKIDRREIDGLNLPALEEIAIQ